MGCCLVALLLAAGPRLVLFLIWLFSDYLTRAFHTWTWPLLGFFFLPLTTLAYAWVVNSGIGLQTPLGVAVIVIAFLFDIGTLGGGRRAQRRWNA